MTEIEKKMLIDRIQSLCDKKGISPTTAYIESGVGKNFKSNLKNANPSDGKLTMLANYFNVSVAYLKGDTDVSTKRPTILEIAASEKIYEGNVPFNEMPKVFESYYENTNGILLSASKLFTIPVYESVSAVFGAYANDSIIDYRIVTLSSEDEANNTLFAVVTDDSMAPKIDEGDLIQVHKIGIVDGGTIAVVVVDNLGEESVLVRKVVYGHGWTELQALNPKYEPIRFERNDIDRIRILGEVTSIVRGV